MITEAQLVYQVGIANLFTIDSDNTMHRVYQGDFRSAENMARGMKLCGAKVTVWHCDVAGDCTHQAWGRGKGGIFSESKASRI